MKTSVLLALILVPVVARGVEPAWRALGSSDGIAVFSKEIPGSPIIAFRGEALIAAPIGKVLSVLSDEKREKEWVDGLVEDRVVRDISEPERIEYSRTSAPWPLADRDFVVWERAKVDLANKRLIVDMHSVEDPAAPPKKGVVRGELLASTWILASKGASGTQVSVEIQADPRGALPKWLVNLYQRSWPRKTLAAMRRQVQKPDVGEDPAFALGN